MEVLILAFALDGCDGLGWMPANSQLGRAGSPAGKGSAIRRKGAMCSLYVSQRGASCPCAWTPARVRCARILPGVTARGGDKRKLTCMACCVRGEGKFLELLKLNPEYSKYSSTVLGEAV